MKPERPAVAANVPAKPGFVAAIVLGLVCVVPAAEAQEWKLAYARGVEALRQGQHGRAAMLLERAAREHAEPGGQVPLGAGRSEEYSPYLRLAKALIGLGDARAAREALKRSESWGRESAEERAQLRAQLEETAPTGPRPRPRPSPGFSKDGEVGNAPPSAATPAAQPPATVATPEGAVSAAPETGPPPLGSLVIVSRPGGAAVYIDDEYVGATDPRSGRLLRSGVPPGLHRLRLAREGHDDVRREASVKAGEPITVDVDLPARTRVGPVALLAIGALVLLWAAWRRRRRAPADVPHGPIVAAQRRAAGAGHAPPRSAPVAPSAPPPLLARAERATPADPTESPDTLVAPAAAAAATGERFGPYRLVQQLGKGGMASVYKAERGDEVSALKRPLVGFLEDRDFLARFSREAEIGRTLHHPNIVRIRDRGEVDGVPYFTMELLEGRTLQSALARDGALAPVAATRVVAQVAEALDYAHLKGVIHRDLKPSNIMLLPDGNVKVMDYGIARARNFEGLTVTGAFLGTPDYVAPETAEGGAVDARSDLYSLGVVFYELVTGKRPFYGATPFETLRKHCTEPPRPPSTVASSVPRDLEALILRLLAKDPAQRFASAEELLIELRGFLNRAP